jgi:hypothetical protein
MDESALAMALIVPLSGRYDTKGFAPDQDGW